MIFQKIFNINFPLNNTIEEEGAGAVSSSDHQNNQKLILEHRGKRPVNNIVIENYPNKNCDLKEYHGILPSSSRETTPLEDKTMEFLDEISFFSGNPFIEVTKGIIHLYKNNELTEVKEGVSKTLCLLAVPALLSCHDILNFIAPCHSVIQYIRIIRDGSPNQYMVILK